MAFVNLHTGIQSSPKHALLSDGAFRLWTNALCWSKEHLTDGFLPSGMVQTFHPKAAKFTAELLCEVVPGKGPLWHAVDGGYAIHDYAQWQDTKDRVQERRQSWRDRQHRKRVTQQGVTQSVTRDIGRDSPVGHVDSPSDGRGGGRGNNNNTSVPAPRDDATEATPGQLRHAALELLDLWRQHGTGAITTPFDKLSRQEKRDLWEALKRRSLSEWEVIFQRAKASDYLSGRDGQYPPMSLWRVLADASKIEAGTHDNRARRASEPAADDPRYEDIRVKMARYQSEGA